MQVSRRAAEVCHVETSVFPGSPGEYDVRRGPLRLVMLKRPSPRTGLLRSRVTPLAGKGSGEILVGDARLDMTSLTGPLRTGEEG